MIQEGATRFAYSGDAHVELIDRAHGKILFDDKHPILAFAQETGVELDVKSSRHYKKLFFNHHPKEDEPYVPIMPDVEELLELCLEMGVHPADLLPLNSSAPLPRAVIHACVMICDDSENFPLSDREHAEFLLEYERFEVEGFKIIYPHFWNLMEFEYQETQLTAASVIPITWNNSGEEDQGAKQLCDVFGYVLYGPALRQEVHPIMPDEIEVDCKAVLTACARPDSLDEAMAYFENHLIMSVKNGGGVEPDMFMQRI